MRRLVKLFFALIAMLSLISCEQKKDEVAAPADSRDAFVGKYSFTATGSLDLYMGQEKLFTLPLDETGEFDITKAQEEGEVLITGYNDTIRANVSGKNLLFESTTTDWEFGEIKLRLTFIYGKATLEDNRLHWNTDVQANGSYGVLSASGTGQIDMVATKN